MLYIRFYNSKATHLPEDGPFDSPFTGSFCCCFGRNSRAASNLPPDIFKARIDASYNKTISFI
jgi:hypothetical protein